ncbi:MAG: ribosome maturation factor RimP [Deltaproteobacteria bacterium]|nr:ribosome maturation factor RimP [Deltaproteobacteria bacterium]
MNREEVADRVEALVQPVLAAQGMELVEVQFIHPRRGRATLRLFVDRPGGITLAEITRTSRLVSDLLDVHDVIGPSYTLEVSSPGLTRELKKPADYARYVGRLVRLTTRAPFRGRQVHLGVLQGLEAEEVCLQEGEELCRIPLKEIARARLALDPKHLGKEAEHRT